MPPATTTRAADEGITTSYYDQLSSGRGARQRRTGWPERYLDIRSPATVSIIEAMIDQQCAAKGFDAVETDIDESYGSTSGFPLTKAIEEQFMTTLADYMHGLGLGWWIKNPDDTGDSYAADMEPLADAVLTEQCNQYKSCNLLSSYVGHKAVFNAEYHLKPAKFCANDARARIQRRPIQPEPHRGTQALRVGRIDNPGGACATCRIGVIGTIPTVADGTVGAHAIPGWYEDPWRIGARRWWDGGQWTGHAWTGPVAPDPPSSADVPPLSR